MRFARPPLHRRCVGCATLAAGKRTAGSWKLEAGSWKLEAGSWPR